MRCQFTVTNRKGRGMALQTTCPFHTSIGSDCGVLQTAAATEPNCTRSRTILSRPGESNSEALERVMACGRCWLIAAKDATSRKEHMAMKDVADEDAQGDKTAQMKSVWDAFGGMASETSSSSSSSSSASGSGSD
eukprot:12087350-Heterocapsa_arctica.AAC.1